MTKWISAISFEAWPQQHQLGDGQLRPAMVNDLEWPRGAGWPVLNFRQAMASVVDQVNECQWMLGHDFRNFMLSVVMPGHAIDPHADQMGPGWLTRVHVPLLTNPIAVMRFPNDTSRWDVGREWNLQVGEAYLVDISQVHEVRNSGTTPRVHFMFDVFPGG